MREDGGRHCGLGESRFVLQGWEEAASMECRVEGVGESRGCGGLGEKV